MRRKTTTAALVVTLGVVALYVWYLRQKHAVLKAKQDSASKPSTESEEESGFDMAELEKTPPTALPKVLSLTTFNPPPPLHVKTEGYFRNFISAMFVAIEKPEDERTQQHTPPH